jgi:hypothetical protein
VADPPLSRHARRPASHAAAIAAARASATQATGVAEPSGASSAQMATGSGLNAGPAVVLSVPDASSRPHSSHIHGS